MDLEKLCKSVCRCVNQTAEMIRKERENFSIDSGVEVKGHSNFVTYIDKLSEEKLVDELSKLLPEAGFIAEEGTSNRKGEVYNWVIDPIDGTTNFIHGLTPHAISVALMRNNEVVLGVVEEISHNELFYAWEGSKAYLNNEVISVTPISDHQNALIATGFPYTSFGKMEKYQLCLRELMETTGGVRRLGSAAIDICYIACGRFEAFWEYGLHPWDVAAGVLILKQAGGLITDFKGGNDYIFNGEIIAGNHNYFSKFYEIVSRHMVS